MKPDELEPFKSPYEGTKETELVRVNADVSKADKNLISSIHVTRGFTHIAIATLFKRIADECRQRKWTYLEMRDLELFTMRLLRSPVDISDGDALRNSVREDVRRTVEGGSDAPESDTNLEPDSARLQTSEAKSKRIIAKRRKGGTEEKG